MTYDEALEATVSRAEALQEVARHGIEPEEFFEALGDRSEYQGRRVLAWLGY